MADERECTGCGKPETHCAIRGLMAAADVVCTDYAEGIVNLTQLKRLKMALGRLEHLTPHMRHESCSHKATKGR